MVLRQHVTPSRDRNPGKGFKNRKSLPAKASMAGAGALVVWRTLSSEEVRHTRLYTQAFYRSDFMSISLTNLSEISRCLFLVFDYEECSPQYPVSY